VSVWVFVHVMCLIKQNYLASNLIGLSSAIDQWRHQRVISDRSHTDWPVPAAATEWGDTCTEGWITGGSCPVVSHWWVILSS